MAVLPQALEFDQTPNKILLQRAEEARQQDLLMRKLDADNKEKQFQVLKEINPATLYPKFEREVVDNAIGWLTKKYSDYIRQNPNAGYVDLQNMLNQDLSEIASWSARVKTVKDNIDKSVQAADPVYDKGRTRALALDRALYKTDQLGRKVLKSAQEIDIENDIVSIVQQEAPEKLIDEYKGQEVASKIINDASLFTEDITEEVDSPNGKKTIVKGRKSSLPFYLEVVNGVVGVKKGSNGYIDEDVFNRFYSNPSVKVFVDGKAKELMEKASVATGGATPSNPGSLEMFKRTFVTSWLEQNKKGVIDKVDKSLVKTSPTTNVYVGGSGPGVVGGRIPAYAILSSVLATGEDIMNSTKIDNNIKNAILSIADENGKLRAINRKYSPSMIEVKKDADGSIGIYQKGGGLITSLSEQSFDMEVNNRAGSKYVQNSANQGNPTPSQGSGVKWK